MLSTMNTVELSEYGRRSTVPSAVARMMSAFASGFRDGVDINLGVGYVNEATIPTAQVLEATAEVLAAPERFRQPLNYGGPTGSLPLKDAIRRYWLDNAVGGVSETHLAGRRIIIGLSGATSLLYAVAGVMDPGIVVTGDPMYYIYTNVLRRRGFEILAIPEDDEGPRADLLEAELERLGERAAGVRYIYLVTISNPTGTICTTARKAAWIDAARRLSERLGRRVPVILDRAYEDLIHDPDVAPPASGLTLDGDGLVYEVSTLSKIVAPGLRIGYMIGPDTPLLRAIVQTCSDMGFSASPALQSVAASMLDRHVTEQIQAVNAGYRRRAQQVGAAIDELLGDVLEHRTGGQAGFYYYLTFRDVETHDRSPLLRFLSRTTGDDAVDGPADDPKPRVVTIPGEICVDPGGRLVEVGKRQMRLSYGYEDPRRVVEGLRLIREGVAYARG
ncbi:MAG: aminotransferase class I/II-fold pyridoxal phosphate-dependent enzyme [Planctomycetota bacterium]